ncbi:phosphatase PAP2 family protein [Halococcus sp. IIIV-5B]|uniref:phosphatase PAP2 family protein n=1 Tax=Halococcus sp. IIIV-5B TaxID=2321230 RepID=UPI000E76724F|nr:phosphatase PAP2 family protein [Halococcus sp. IIIV-5B]RJT07201.1 phosphatase PAP2 family protein [Halococcus sp. IIIV-5B]
MGLLHGISEWVLALDETVARAMFESRTPVVTKVMTSVTGLGSATAALVFLGLFYLADWRRELKTAAPALMLTGAVVFALMLGVDRAFPPNPVCLTSGSETVTSSFPSGHAAAATVFALVARRSTVLPSILVTILAAAVAISRVYLGTHYLSDTVAGVVIGAAAFALVACGLSSRERRTGAFFKTR